MILPPSNRFLLLWLAAYSVAMAFVESAVVVYLRNQWYPSGFAFPLVALDSHTVLTEILREAATLVMLISVSFLAARTSLMRFAYFLFCFGLWDLFYYIFLKLLIGWPATLMDWDILFLIPVPWTGPVVAPCLLSLLMIAMALLITRAAALEILIKIPGRAWAMLGVGSMIVIFSFCMDYLLAWVAGRNMESYIPQNFPWWLFITGLAIIITGMLILFRMPGQKRFMNLTNT